MKSAIAILGAAIASAWAAPALAGGGRVSLAPSGRTIGGPIDTTIAAGVNKTVASGIPSVNACVTLANTGTAAVELNLVGGGTGTQQVPTRETTVFCRAGLQSVTVNCLATGGGSCSVSWRLDSAE